MKDGEIKHKLSPAQVSVMLHRVTEPPYFGKFWDHFEDGVYRCAACDTALFSSEEKFDSKTGWPSFKRPLNERDLQFKSEAGPDDKVELRCKKCKGHLGYVISGDNPYYRINSVCLVFEKRVTAPVATPAADQSADKKTAPKKPEEKPTETVPPVAPVPTIGWTNGSLVAASVISLIVGVLGSYLYLTYVPLPTFPETATSTIEVATSTEEATPTPVKETARKQPEKTPVTEPETVAPETSVTETAATSTQ